MNKIMSASFSCLIYLLIIYARSNFFGIYQNAGLKLPIMTEFLMNIPLFIWIIAIIFSLSILINKLSDFSAIWFSLSFLIGVSVIITLMLPFFTIHGQLSR